MLHRVQVNRHISISTVQRTLRVSGHHDRISAKKPLWKDTNNKKRLAWVKKHEQWTLDQWKFVLWSDESTFWDFLFQPLCLCETQSRWTDDLRICGSHSEAWRKRCDGPLLVTLSVIYFELKAWLPQHCAAIRHPIWFGLNGTIICFSTGQCPTHL